MKIVIKKVNCEVEVDFAALPQASQEYVIRYGLTQSLNDAHASIGTDEATEESVMERVNERLQALVAGTPPSVGQRGDSLTAEVRTILVNLLRSTGMKAAEAKDAAKDIGKGITTLLERKKLPTGKADMKKALETITAQAEHVIELRNTTLDLG